MVAGAVSSLSPFLPAADGEVPGRLLAGGAAGVLAGRHHPLEHLPGHIALPDERGHQPVLPHHHSSTGASLPEAAGPRRQYM